MGGQSADSSPAAEAASESAARAAAARCEAERRSCCKILSAHPVPAANAPAQDNRHSNTAPSNRANTASSLSVLPNVEWRREGSKARRNCALRNPKCPVNWRDFAPCSLVCQAECIQLVGVQFHIGSAMPEAPVSSARTIGICWACCLLRNPAWLGARPPFSVSPRHPA